MASSQNTEKPSRSLFLDIRTLMEGDRSRCQRAATFTIDQAMEKMEASISGAGH
jgi:hypothetical protein